MKLIRLHTTRYISGSPLEASENLGLTRDKLPKALGPLKTWVRAGDPQGLSAALTLLTLGRVLESKWETPNLSTISDPPRTTSEIIPDEFIQRFTNHFRLVLNPVWKGPHWTTKAGPHGPALWTSLSDLMVLPSTLKDYIYTLGGPPLEEYMLNIEKLGEALPFLTDRFKKKLKQQPLRKLSLIKDKEAKTRIIAILDYWSQTALIPLHDELFKVLRRLPQDMTFNQGNFYSSLTGSGPFFSFDLSAATDRFPLTLQKRVIGTLLGQKYAEAWAAILTQFEFTPNWTTGTIKYGAGQPMGAYSSWAAFTLTHHLIVQYASHLAGKGWTNSYVLLGDDIVINDPEIAKFYQEVITSLGVDISPTKTHVSLDTYEFAKRWIHKGIEITPFPLGSLFESKGSYTLLAETLRTALKRGLQPTINGLSVDISDPGFCASIFEAFGKHPLFQVKLAYKLRRLLYFPLSHDEVEEKAIAFLRLIGVSTPCTWRVATVARIFERVAALAKAQELSKEARGLAKYQVKWFKTSNQVIEQAFPDMASQSSPSPIELQIPLFTVLDRKIQDLSVLVSKYDRPRKEDIHKLIYDTPLLSFPDLDRIDPTRASLRILSAQSRFVKLVSTVWLTREKLVNGTG